MKDFDELRAEIAAERARLEAQDWTLTMLEEAARKIASHGYVPIVDVLGGHVSLVVDFSGHWEAPSEGAAPARSIAAIAAELRKAPEAEGCSAATEAPEPEQPAEEPVPDPEPELRTGPWSEDEIATATEILRRGGTCSDVAAALNRGAPNVHWRCNKIKAQLVAKKDQPKPEPKPEPAAQGSVPPQPAPVAPRSPAPGGSSDGVAEQPATVRQVQAHLNALGHIAPWTAAKDLKLAAGIARGDGLGATAEALGVEKGEALARWKALCPVVTIDSQRLLLEELRKRADAQVAA